MTLKIAQEAAAEDDAHWRWAVWLDGPARDLDQVKKVVWKLHPTFNKPNRRVDSRSTQFRLDASGWGEFEIQAQVERQTGKPEILRHWLRLEEQVPRTAKTRGGAKPSKAAAAQAAPSQRRPAVFLSYDRQDADLADNLAQELRKQDITAFLDIDIPSGEDLSRWRAERIADSDVIVVLGANQPGIWQKREIDIALSFGTRVIPVAFSTSGMPESLRPFQAMKIKPGNPDGLAVELARRIGSEIKA